jgi:hypothetical protein
MVRRLLQQVFDGDPAMRARLLVALVIGGDVEVPRGKRVGATFDHLPLCAGSDEKGCVIAYRSHEEGAPVSPGRAAPGPGSETACVNPADPASDARRPFAGAYIPVTESLRPHLAGVDDVKTPFVGLHGFYAGRCVDGPDGYRYLSISLARDPGDVRVNPVDFAALPLRKALGLHVLDFQLPQDDLIEQVSRRLRADHPGH